MPEERLRETKYAKELARAVVRLPSGDEARLERIQNKKKGIVLIRFSWWKDGRRMIPRPLDLTEADLTKLLAKGIQKGVLALPLPGQDRN